MKKNTGLWIVQGLLAAMFLLAGVPKLIMSAAQMAAPGPIQVPVLFVRFIGVCEILGAIGMVLPGLTGIKPGLTPLAAGAWSSSWSAPPSSTSSTARRRPQF